MGILGSINRIFGRQTDAEPAVPAVRLADMAATPPDEVLPFLDRGNIDESTLSEDQKLWRHDGVLVLRNFMPPKLVDAYVRRRAADAGPAGWLMGSPYVHVPEMRDLALYPPLLEKMNHLIGEDMLLHLCLTGWISTERQWHQDEYLSPDFVQSWYAAVWIALDTITPDCGPFEYVPGSHRWPLVNGAKVRTFMTPEEQTICDPVTGTKDWPKVAERFVTPAFEYEIKQRRARIQPFLAEKGDVLIWHGRLAHRGSMALQRGKERRSLIAHYTGVNHRPDMPARATHELGGQYALFDTPLKV